MRFSVGLPRPDEGPEYVRPDGLAEIAVAIEEAGLDACFLTDHPFPLVDHTRTGHHAFDPIATIGYLAAVTRTLTLHANVLIVPYRNPFIVANAVATLNGLSGGRLVFGVGAGYQAQEFGALGVDYARRTDLMEEAFVAMRAAWTGQPVHLSGHSWMSAGNSMLPMTAMAKDPPIWRGGNSTLAMDQAVRHCQGWSPFETPGSRSVLTSTARIASLDDLGVRIATFNSVLKRYERQDPMDICFVRGATNWFSSSPEAIKRDLEIMRRMGVTWVASRFESAPKAQLLDRIYALGKLVSNAG